MCWKMLIAHHFLKVLIHKGLTGLLQLHCGGDRLIAADRVERLHNACAQQDIVTAVRVALLCRSLGQLQVGLGLIQCGREPLDHQAAHGAFDLAL